MPAKPEGSRTSGQLPSSAAFELPVDVPAAATIHGLTGASHGLWTHQNFVMQLYRSGGLAYLSHAAFLWISIYAFRKVLAAYETLWKTSCTVSFSENVHWNSKKKKQKKQDLSTYSNCSRKVPRCFALGFHMKTSESVRICIGVFSRLFESSWTGTNCLILHFVCSLPACTHCHRRKAEQIRQQTLSLLTHAVKPCSQVLLAGSQSTDTEINKPQQFGFMLKFQHCILIFFFFLPFSFFLHCLSMFAPTQGSVLC